MPASRVNMCGCNKGTRGWLDWKRELQIRSEDQYSNDIHFQLLHQIHISILKSQTSTTFTFENRSCLGRFGGFPIKCPVLKLYFFLTFLKYCLLTVINSNVSFKCFYVFVAKRVDHRFMIQGVFIISFLLVCS